MFKKSRFYCLNLFLLLSGCGKMTPVSLVPDVSVVTEAEVPVSLGYVSESVLHNVLGDSADANSTVLFNSDSTDETLVVFDANLTRPLKIAQVRRIAGRKGSSTILMGLSLDNGSPTITKADTIERGDSMPGLKPYLLGKKRFLAQYEGRSATDAFGGIDGISGATPIWKPVAGNLKEMVWNLVKLASDTEFLNRIRTDGRVWQGRAADNTKIVIEDVNTKVAVESQDGDLLFAHWRIIGFSELGILGAGVLIVLVAQLKRLRRQ